MSINVTNDDEPILRDGRDSNESSRWRCCDKKKKKKRKSGMLETPGDSAFSDDDDMLLETGCCFWERFQKVQWFWAELVLFLYMFCDFPVTFVNQKYVLEWITVYSWNQDLLHNITHDFNVTNGDTISTCIINTSSPEFAFNQRNQKMTSYFGMLRMAVWVFPAMFSTLVLGSVSDRHGRKWAFIPPILGNFVTTFAVIFLIHFKGSILWLLILDFTSGLSGSFGCVILAGVAHVVGKTTAQNRMFRITVLQLSLLGGSTVSPFTMGQAYAHLGPTITLIITAVASGVNLLYCLACIPAMKDPDNSGIVVDNDHYEKYKSYSVDEPSSPSVYSEGDEGLKPGENGSTPPTPGSQGERSSGNPQGSSESGTSSTPNLFRQISEHVRNTCGIYSNGGSRKSKNGAGRSQQADGNTETLTSSLISTFSNLSHSLDITSEMNKSSREIVCRLRILILAFFVIITAYFDVVIMTLFELNSPLCWDSSTIGLYTGVLVSVAALGSVVLAPIMERFSSHITVAIICCLTSASYRIYLFFVRDTNSMFYGVILNVFNMMLIPSVRTMMTLLVEPGRHGAVLGSISAVEILCCFLGSIIFSIVYSATLFYSTATVFLVSASLYGLGAIIFMCYRIRYGTGSGVVASMNEILA